MIECRDGSKILSEEDETKERAKEWIQMREITLFINKNIDKFNKFCIKFYEFSGVLTEIAP